MRPIEPRNRPPMRPGEGIMFKYLIAWLLGVPITLLLIVWLIFGF
jgi:hypothetical protein